MGRVENTPENNVEKSQLESVENVDRNGIIDYSNRQQNIFDIDSLPEQVHHFATNKNKKYSPLFNEIVSRYGLDLDGDWNMERMKQRGKHPNRYHDHILFKIKKCDMTASGDVDIFIREFEQVKKKIMDNPLMLRKAFWKGKDYEILFDDV